ncbi:N-acetylglucosamine-specific PTS transporter subunit IIBC [Bacillus fonticola]|uniref:N-acetylglucosamine-specific PTS transporter subunit IIBC n=1 Tax=Bacillus fonticola TaxID=2728853 RepID=UPI0014730030|nr:N-acetylglucosamine-specific PTS transporter subunit IIBC [Bacillus fonticola]
MFRFLQQLGRSLMLPIATLPVAALLVRLGATDVLDIPFIAAAGDTLLANLPLLFAIGVAIGFAKDNNGAAGLAGAIGYLVLSSATAAFDETINMSFLGGLISGVIAGLLYNRYHDIKLPQWLGFFGGRRFVPIITALTMVLLSILFGFIWPAIQAGIDQIGIWLIDAGAVGAGLYGFFNRLLIPIGIHHVLNSFIWFQFGEFNGATGDLNRFFAGDPTAGVFMAGFFPMMMFGLPAACLAMIYTAKKENRKMVAGMLGSLALTSFLTGITEPIEFTFMFLSPLLYGVHAVLTGLSLVVTNAFGVLHGFGFSAGFLDYVLSFNIATKPLLIIPIGLGLAVLYFVIFTFLIKKLDLKTPGREDEGEESLLAENKSIQSKADDDDVVAAHYIEALGGKDNIDTCSNCVTRLRMRVNEMQSVDEKRLKSLGAKGVVKLNDHDIQVIVGTNVERIANRMRQQL